MPTHPYKVDGKRVPGVTTILSRWKESGGLLYWSWNEGREGRDFRETRDAAADAGTIAHAMVEGDIRGRFVDLTKFEAEAVKKATHAFRAYEEWKANNKVKPIRTEMPLVSSKYMFGGTIDAILVNGSLRMGDWKTSNGIYTDHLLQVAGGYTLLWEEHNPDIPIEGIEILRFSKPIEEGDPVSFAHHYWSPEVIPIAQKQFLLLREAYDLDKRLKTLL